MNTGVDYHALIQGMDLPDPGTELMSPAAPALQVDILLLRYWGSPQRQDSFSELKKEMEL